MKEKKEYMFRFANDNENFLSFLLPMCLLHSAIKSNSEWQRLIFFLLLWLPVSFFIGRKCLKAKSLLLGYSFYVIFAIPASIFLSWVTFYDFIKMYMLCLIVSVSYNLLISALLNNFPGSFTLVEVHIIAQGIHLFVLHCLFSFKQFGEFDKESSLNTQAMDLLKLLLLGLLLLVCSLYTVPSLRIGVKFHFACFTFAIGMIVLWCSHYQSNIISWFWKFLTHSHKRIYLLSFWVISTLITIIYVTWLNQKPGYSASTMDRKIFHFIINTIYLPGIIYDIQFLCFASVVALGAFIVLEIYRVLDIPIFGPAIDQAFKIFLDEKDSGILILTHIYLLIGCSSPLWLSSFYVHKNIFHISLLSGIISVGFGDTFAAIGGTLYGKHYWQGSKKTIEGTISAIVVQLVCIYFFLLKSRQFLFYNISIATLSVLLTSLLEAKTTHIDNLVLPFCMYMFLVWID